jgi:hypothetical protein
MKANNESDEEDVDEAFKKKPSNFKTTISNDTTFTVDLSEAEKELEDSLKFLTNPYHPS